MGLIRHGVPEEFADSLQKEFDIKCFVETGTLGGLTAKWAAERFEQVFTIELSEKIYRRAVEALAPYRNVTVLHGDTREHLRRLAPSLPPSIVWLDAHYSGTGTAGEGDECPLLGEIEALGPVWDRMFVLVDDARYFLAPPPPPHDASQWPSIAEVMNALDRGEGRFVASFEDVIVSLPPQARMIALRYIHGGGRKNERVLGFTRPEASAHPLKKLIWRLHSRSA